MKSDIDYGRSIGAVVAGYFVMTGLGAICTMIAANLFSPLYVGQTPIITTWYLLLMLLINIGTSLVGGYVTAAIAGVYRWHHAAVLAGIIFAMGMLFLALPVGVFPGRQIFPSWYPLTSSLITPLSIVAGGWVRHRKAA